MTEGRWLTANDAAAYLSLSTEGFRRKVRAGVLPRPSQALGAALPRWDREALDAAMAGGAGVANPEEEAEALAQKIAGGSPRRRRKPAC